MFLRIINDTHVYGVNPTHWEEELKYVIQSSKWPVILNGDIVDIANCKYEDLGSAYTFLTWLQNHVEFKVRGNHECNSVSWPDELMVGKLILIAHGDISMWGIERSDKFRNQKHGAGSFKRALSSVLDGLRHYWAVRPNDSLIQWVKDAKKRYPELKYCIFGHSHPNQIIEFEVDGVKAMILPRGVNDINLLI